MNIAFDGIFFLTSNFWNYEYKARTWVAPRIFALVDMFLVSSLIADQAFVEQALADSWCTTGPVSENVLQKTI